MKNNPNKQPASLDAKAASRQLLINWLKTGFGIGLLSFLTGALLYAVGLKFSFILAILGLFGVALPVFSWYNSAKLVKRLMKCEAPNPANKNHMRLVRLVDELFPLTGLKKKPEVMVSPIPMPNAFATGRNANNAFIAATEGLFSCDLTDAEIKGVLAHELAHVKSHDVAITSLTSVLASLFAIVLATGFPRFFQSAFVGKNDDLLDKLSKKVKTEKKGFVAPIVGVAGFFFSLILFWLISFCAKFVTLFVSRARESAADVVAVQWTGDPCALSTALQKIIDWTERHVMLLRLKMMLDGMGPMLFVSLGEGRHDRKDEDGPSSFSKWWHEIGANHPPIDKRLAMLDHLSGQTCPALEDVRRQEEAAFEEMIRRKYGHLRPGNQSQEPADETEITGDEDFEIANPDESGEPHNQEPGKQDLSEGKQDSNAGAPKTDSKESGSGAASGQQDKGNGPENQDPRK